MVPGKYVSTEEFDFVCESSKFCDKTVSSGIAQCNVTEENPGLGDWVNPPGCDRAAVKAEGRLIFLCSKISLSSKN